MNPGLLNQPLKILLRDEGRDRLGQPVTTWTEEDGQIWARLMRASGATAENSDREQSESITVFRCRRQSKVSTLNHDDRISWKGTEYLIDAIDPVGDGNEFVEIRLKSQFKRTD